MTLPRGWTKATLGEVRSDRSEGVIPSRVPDERFELYSVPAHPNGAPEIALGREIGSNKQTVEPGTVLLCKINPRINRVWVVGTRSSLSKIASTEWIPFFPIDGVDSRYLANFLRRDELRAFLASNVSGVGGSLMRVRPATVAPVSFPLAPLAEQHRIVAAIEEQLSRVDAGVAALVRVQKELARYRASVLKAACEGRLVATEAALARAEGRSYEPASELLARILAERRARWDRKKKYAESAPADTSSLAALPEGWVWATMEQLSSLITKGTTPTSIGHAFAEAGIRFVKVESLSNGRVLHDRCAFVGPETDEALKRSRLQPGDLLVTIAGTLGRTAIVSEVDVPANTNQAVAIVRLVDTGLGRFARIWIDSVATTAMIDRLRRGVGMSNLNLEQIGALRIPLPPLPEQHRIVAEVERRLSIADEVAASVESALARAARLRQSILKRAFEGRLVSQDPSDEPASALLERIRAERSSVEPKPKKRKHASS